MIKYLEQDFDKEIANKKIVVDFYADWCGPCKMIGEVFKEIESEILIDILKVNVDKFSEIAREYGIMSIPTIYLFDNNEVLKKHTGYMNKTELIDFINQK